jgi:hypothetical protein
MGIFYKLGIWVRDFFRVLKQRVGYSLAVILLLGVAATMTNLNNHLYKRNHGVVVHDVIGYYGYLPTVFIYKDLSLGFISSDPKSFVGKIHVHSSPSGGGYFKMTMGLAFLYLPFFLIGHFSAWISGAEMSGFSQPYMFWLQFSSLFYLLIGLLTLRSVLLRYFKDGLVSFVLLAVVAGTNLFYYVTLEAAMSHAYNFFLFCLFIWLTIRWYEQPSAGNSIAVGLVFGLIALIRPTNGLIVIFFLLFNVYKRGHLARRIKLFIEIWPQILLIALFAFVVVFPQLLFWKMNTGSWIFYTYGNEGFFFDKPQIIRGLFSYRKGWLLYTPIMIFGLAGIYFLRKRLPAFFLPILLFMLLNIYVIYSWWDFSYGGSFGSRPMIDSYGLMAISMAAMLDSVQKNRKLAGYLVKGIMLVLILFSIFQTVQYKYQAIHFSEMSKAAYWHNFGKVKADKNFFDLLEPLDYASMTRGVYATKPKIRNWIYDQTSNSFETLNKDGSYFLSDDRKYQFVSFESQSDLDARSGKYSSMLLKDKSFSSGIDFFVSSRQRYKVTVWKKPANAHASLVMASVKPDEFYFLKEEIDSTDVKGWGRISFEVEMPEKINQMYRVYVWNKSQDTVFFDDLKIELLQR